MKIKTCLLINSLALATCMTCQSALFWDFAAANNIGANTGAANGPNGGTLYNYLLPGADAVPSVSAVTLTINDPQAGDLNIELSTPSGSSFVLGNWDNITATDVSLSGAYTFNSAGSGGSYDAAVSATSPGNSLNNTKTYTWSSAPSPNGPFNSGTWTLRIENNGSTLGTLSRVEITPVPEPHEYAFIAGLGLIGFAAYRRFVA